MIEQYGLIFAYLLDGQGGGRAVGWEEIRAHSPEREGILWLHCHPQGSVSRPWLERESGIDPVLVETLLEEENRPRRVVRGNAMLMSLRGVNLNPGQDPEDMVFLNLWVETWRVITLRTRRILAIDDLREQIEAGHGPRDSGELLFHLAHRLVDRMEPVLTVIEQAIDAFEARCLEGGDDADMEKELSDTRRSIILLRRYLAPQREALTVLSGVWPPWMDDRRLSHMREVAAHVLHFIEELDANRERAALVQEEIDNLLSRRMNHAVYLLTLVTGVFLPLGLLTGLLGVNVGGIPGTENPWAFWIVCAVMAVLAGAGYWIFRRLRWL